MFIWLQSVFANPLLLSGTLAGAIPVIIHLLNRQRYKRIWWAAMHWLWAAMKKSKRRLQIEQLILLILRTLILILLALALARPVLEAATGLLGGRASTYRLILLDNSYSMGCLVNNRPLFDKAKETARLLVGQLSRSDEVDLLLVNSDCELLRSAERDAFQQELQAAQLSDSASNIPKGIAVACRTLLERKSKAARKEIIVLTDQTKRAWLNAHGQPRRLDPPEEEAVRKVFGGQERERPTLYLVRYGLPSDRTNLAAAKLEVDDRLVTVGVEAQMSAEVCLFSPLPIKKVPVTLYVDGERTTQKEIAELAPFGGPAAHNPHAAFQHVFEQAGGHGLHLQLAPDLLPTDNQAYLALDAEKEVRVLCVDGQQRLGPNASELDFFRQALSPTRAKEVQAGAMPLQPEVISDGAFVNANLDEYRLVVLGNVARIPEEKVQVLGDWVRRRGGSLWVWLGDRVSPDFYNRLERVKVPREGGREELEERGMGALMPATVGEAVGQGDPEGPAFALSVKDLNHPVMQKYSSLKSLSLSGVNVYRYFKLAPKPGREGRPEESPRVVLRYENGEPAAVEWRVGEGRVLLVGTAADKAWSNWPSRNDYMVLVNLLALDLIQPPHALRNRLVGERFVYKLAREELGQARTGLFLRHSSGLSLPMEVEVAAGIAVSHPIPRAGLFKLELQVQGQPRVVTFAANRDLEESNLELLDDQELRLFLPGAGEAAAEAARLFPEGSLTRQDLVLTGEEPERLEEAMKERRSARETWRWLLAVVIALLAVESVLAWRFGRH
jgi:hypothetical protein